MKKGERDKAPAGRNNEENSQIGKYGQFIGMHTFFIHTEILTRLGQQNAFEFPHIMDKQKNPRHNEMNRMIIQLPPFPELYKFASPFNLLYIFWKFNPLMNIEPKFQLLKVSQKEDGAVPKQPSFSKFSNTENATLAGLQLYILL